MSFGAYPLVSLSAARDAHDCGRKTLAGGVDPMAEKKAVTEAQNQSTILNPFRDVEALWFEKWKVDKDQR